MGNLVNIPKSHNSRRVRLVSEQTPLVWVLCEELAPGQGGSRWGAVSFCYRAAVVALLQQGGNGHASEVGGDKTGDRLFYI